MGSDEPIDEGTSWHLDKRWHITQIVSLLIMTLTGVVFIIQRDNQYDKRLTMLENANMQQHERDIQQDRDVSAAVELMRRQLDRIEDKMDRAFERDFQLNGRAKK